MWNVRPLFGTGFNTYGFDTGIFDQGLWLMSRFDSPFITINGRHLFGDHTSFLLVALVPARRRTSPSGWNWRARRCFFVLT